MHTSITLALTTLAFLAAPSAEALAKSSWTLLS